MRRLPKVYLLFLLLLVGLTNCKKDLDTYYERPSTLAPPIYQQLEARGNFKNFLALIDRANYKKVLSSGGYWTCFAPNDVAFTKFLQENNYSSISDLDSLTAGKIVRYMLIYNAYDSAKLDDYQSNLGAQLNISFKRKTAYYKWIYNDTLNNQTVKVYNGNLNGTSANADDNNNKYIPYFTNKYFANKNLTAADYNFFYPGIPFTGLNVVDANVVNMNLPAENGYIYELDKVVLPLPSIYEYLEGKPQYSEFLRLVNKFRYLWIGLNLQQRMLQATGSTEPVYYKSFTSELAFSPNNENFMKQETNDAQKDGWSVFVPTNDAIIDFERNVLAEYYNNDINQIPDNVIAEFLNSHMWQTIVWPSKFSTTSNYLGEEARFDSKSNVLDAKILSNGFFYGTNKVQKSNTFTSVYAAPFLNPAYSFMIRNLGLSLKFLLSNPRIKATLFLVSDQSYATRGFTFNNNYNAWWWYGSSSVANQWVASAKDKLTRDMNLQIAFTYSGELDDLSGEGIVKTNGQECIKFKNNQIFGAGNVDSTRAANVLGYREYANGRVYFLDKMIEYSEVSPAGHLRILAGYNPETRAWGAPTNYYMYYKYLVGSGLVTMPSAASTDSSRMLITGVSSGDFWTFMVPTNAAINVYRTLTVNALPSYTATDPASLVQIKRFVLYHILNKIIIANGDEGDNGKTNTAYKNLDGIIQAVTLINQKDNLKIKDANGVTVSVINAQSNNLSSLAIIHQIDNYLSTNQ